MPYGALKRPKDGVHRVTAGETISSIAATYGFTDWEAKLWNAAENAKLKEQRLNPNTLAPGDEVSIPDLTPKDESRPTDAWHDFHVVRNKRFLRLKLQDENGEPIANKAYEIRPVQTFRGTFVQQGQTTDAEGKIEEEIPHTLFEAELVLPDTNIRTHLKIGFLQPLPMGEKVKATPSLSAEGLLDAAKGAAGSLLGAAQGAAGGLAGAAMGAASSAAGSLSGGLSGGIGGSAGASGGGAGGGIGGGFSGGLSGVAGAAGGLMASAKGAAGVLMKAAAGAASSMAGVAGKAVGNLLGEASFGNDTDTNIYPAAQRLVSLGYDAGEPRDNRRTAQFSAALMAFQTWCKDKGSMSSDAGGPLGGLTSPGGMLGGGGGLAGALAGAVAGPMLAAVGLTGQLDEETINALKKTHGC
ncbi:MAG: LysM peptidoglycan-binding domain-containing protein [Planctomycetes bacterium]|nr:LysM peptidoglycan-binding domain-containing protein [Planctomycetota bacterium]